MRETSESLIHLDHVSSSVFYNLLEFAFYNKFKVPQEELGTHIQVSSYLLAEAFLSKCLSVLADELSPGNSLSYLSLAQEICCVELKMTVFTYLSRNLLELPDLIKCLNDEEKDIVVHLRTQGHQRLCSLRKENLTSWNDPETERARHIFTLKGRLPAACQERLGVQDGFLQHRRHFSAVACEDCIYAVGGWYLDSLVTPDSSTALYTAVERYDPWDDAWRFVSSLSLSSSWFVSSLPLTDFQFTMSLSHDVPLATSLGHCLYVLGSIQRTGEKLLLQYNTGKDCWSELLPTLTRVDADLPTLYFLGATDRLLVIGTNNSENVVTSFCVQSKRWGQAHRAEKVAFAGQGTVVGDQVLMPSIEHNTVARMDLQTLSLRVLPPLPISTRYEAIFYLNF
ncbi:uncharacterized protein LOC122874694 isoform X5 [Siniperca chuatsi]|uniref:uncharacterized protein LOC122874694 isoform X5 n=1 Tax=Siniperca chuatsi TaxID=119488 RepID=UPI001CE08592|nr:uncharacterized protein LOC122874694 isoform X5 [Siniperca chuatsi]